MELLLRPPEEKVNWLDVFRQYLVTNVDFLASEKNPMMPDESQFTKVSITVTNSAPVCSSHDVVFTGICLSAARTNEGTEPLTPEYLNFSITRHGPPETGEYRERKPQVLNFIRMNGDDFTEVCDEQQNGETLIPGESLSFEMDIPNSDLPYYQFRLDSNISMHHLLHGNTILPIAEEYTRPIIQKALSNFNSLDIHRPFKTILISTPGFDNDTRLSEIRSYFGLLTEEEGTISAIQKNVDNLYRTYKFRVFQDHMDQVYKYLEHIKAAIKNLHEAVSSGVPESISQEVANLEAINTDAGKINRETESIMSNFNLSDIEVNYKYRS